ncbi:glycosyltransferase family 4 protein [Candidatus Peregrinibacteria bacterium]|nr:glycosyltransferase family 4 protein [Candidatus Peregrinibacteria bacterium]
MKKVVILSAFLSPFRSGAEACAEEVAIRLEGRYDITIVTARMRRGGGGQGGGKVCVIRIGLGFSFDKWLYPFLAPFVVWKLKPDIVHAVLETFAGLALYFCKWTSSGSQRILTLQTTNRSFLKQMIVRSPDTVTAISSALVNIAKEYGREDVHLIPNGISLKTIRSTVLQTQKVEGRILFVGRLEEMKGVDTLLNAFEIVIQRHPRAHLRIVGDGSLRAPLEARAERFIKEGRVRFVGWVSVPDVYKEFAAAQIFCGLSRSEALGNVFLEAMAAECGVVATRVGGIPDIVQDEKTGILVPPDDPDVASAAIEILLTDHEEREQLAQAGRLFAERFDWGEIAERYAQVYENE